MSDSELAIGTICNVIVDQVVQYKIKTHPAAFAWTTLQNTKCTMSDAVYSNKYHNAVFSPLRDPLPREMGQGLNELSVL